MNTMNHGGYTARITFDERDNLFVGRILGLRRIISFHGETVEELHQEFAAVVQDYLQDCKELGVAPEEPASGSSPSHGIAPGGAPVLLCQHDRRPKTVRRRERGRRPAFAS